MMRSQATGAANGPQVLRRGDTLPRRRAASPEHRIIANGTPSVPYLPIQAAVFEAIAGVGGLTGTVAEIAGRFRTAPDDFLVRVGGLIGAGWVTVEVDAGAALRLRLQDGWVPLRDTAMMQTSLLRHHRRSSYDGRMPDARHRRH